MKAADSHIRGAGEKRSPLRRNPLRLDTDPCPVYNLPRKKTGMGTGIYMDSCVLPRVSLIWDRFAAGPALPADPEAGSPVRTGTPDGKEEVSIASWLYETHMHTAPSSACSDTRGRDFIARYIDAGYAGIVITDHFWGGNCGISRSLPWREFVCRFCSGYEDALNEGLRRNFPVYFGWEETFEGDDYLVYGLDKNWLLEHPEVVSWSRREQFEQVHAFGGCVVQAHPFRAASYIRDIHLAPFLADAVEGFNAGNTEPWNILGLRYARLTGLPVTAGSDNHHADRMTPEKLAGVVFDRPWSSLQDYIDAIRHRRPFGVSIPVPLPDWSEAVRAELPVLLHGRDEHPEPVDPVELLSGRISVSASARQ